jgi:cytochrome c oxidase assembly factor CtaG
VAHPWQLVLDWEWIAAIVVIAVDYAVVTRTYARRAQEPVARWRAAAFGAGLLVIALALISPIEHLALTSMLSFHLLQNVMIGDWGPPLLLLGLTPAMAAAVSRSRAVNALTAPAVALGIWLVVWYGTHLPVLYDYALRHGWALGLEHLAFILAGLIFWWPEVIRGRLDDFQRVVYLALALLLVSPLDVYIYLAPHVLYNFYAHTDKLFSMSAMTDQAIAGAAMAAETNVVFLAVIAFTLARLLDEDRAVAGGELARSE